MRKLVRIACIILLTPLWPAAAGAQKGEGQLMVASLLYCIPLDDAEQIGPALVLAESIRDFGGALAQAPIRLYAPEELAPALAASADDVAAQAVELRSFSAPAEALRYALGAKPFAAAQAERDAEGRFALMALLAPNTIMLGEPGAFLLPEGIQIGYSTVHHRNIGSLAAEPPDAFWSRLYAVLAVPDSAIYTNESLADRQTLRFYVNAGSIVVRPEAGLMREWAACFRRLYEDEATAAACAEGKRNIFLHQAALAGAALRLLRADQTAELPRTISYPVFFERIFGGDQVFDSLVGVVTLRYEFDWNRLPASWLQELKAPPGALDWIRARVARP